MDQLAQVLAQLTQQLGMTVNLLWPKIVLVTYFESWAWLVIDLLFIGIIAWFNLKFVPKWWSWINQQEEKLHNDDNLWGYFFVAIFVLVSIIFIVLLIGTFPDLISGILNPEGTTIIHLLNKVTK